jgi:hypothetical protein
LTEATSLLRLLGATLAVGVLPGALVTLLWRPRPRLTMLEVLGYGVAISFGIVQLLTILAISAHVSPGVILALLGAACVAIAAGAIYRRPPGVDVHFDELILACLLAVLAAFLYMLGSPVEWFEDQVHAAIVRRLSALATPRLDDVYFTPGIVYTYPFPGIHYFMALVARLGDLDALFVYHKLRFFWGPAAVLMLYLVARATFGSAAFACGTAITVLALVFSGAFGMVPGVRSGWGQLTPFSHASDVAMTVLLPALMAMAFGYLLAASRRERGFFLTGSAMLVVMLTIVHIRELVQMAAYLGCFLMVALAMRRFRPYVSRTAIMLALVVSIAAVYTLWMGQVVERTAAVVADQRARLASIAATSSLGELILTPAPALLDEFVLNNELLFVNLTPLFLFAGPAVLILFRGRPLVWLAVISTAVYLLVMTVPLLAIPYIYVTYFEILFSPVRNVIFFVYLFAGAAIYAAVAALDRRDRTRLVTLLAGAAAGGLAVLVALSINQTSNGFVVPLLGGYLLALMVAPEIPRWGMNARSGVAAALVVAGCVALWPQRDPAVRVTQVAVRWSADVSDQERAALERQFSLTDGEPNSNRTAAINVWNYALANTGADNVRALVTHSRVVDTGGIERDTYVVPPQPPSQDDPYFAVQRIPLLQYPGGVMFVAAGLFVWTIGFLVPVALASPKGQRLVFSLEPVLARPFHTRIVSFACFLIPFALLTARPTLSPVSAAGASAAATPSEMVAAMPCLTTDARPAPYSEDLLAGEAVMLPERTSCPPPDALVAWIRSHIPVDAVFAIDRWNPYLPSVFVPQQVVVYPQVEVTFENEDQLFAAYYRFYNERLRTSRVQPFFNSVETPMQRAAFVEALGVTHVLVDPAYHNEMRTVLDGLPDEYALRFTDGEWAVYEVLRPRTGTQPRV